MNTNKIIKKMYNHLDKPKGQMSLFDEDNMIISLRNSSFKTTKDKNKDREFYAVWWLTVHVPDGYGDENTPREVWKTWSNLTYKLCSYLSCSGGYNPEIIQSSVRVSLSRNFSDLKEFEKEWNLFVPLIKEKADGYKYISIFENSLSASGVYSIRVYSDHYDIMKTTYGRPDLIKSFTEVSELAQFISDNIWYGDEEDECY